MGTCPVIWDTPNLPQSWRAGGCSRVLRSPLACAPTAPGPPCRVLSCMSISADASRTQPSPIPCHSGTASGSVAAHPPADQGSPMPTWLPLRLRILLVGRLLLKAPCPQLLAPPAIPSAPFHPLGSLPCSAHPCHRTSASLLVTSIWFPGHHCPWGQALSLALRGESHQLAG